MADRRTRDLRIRELDRAGWSHDRIADEIGVSRQRVSQILTKPDPEILLLERELQLNAEKADLLLRNEAGRHRLRAVQRGLDRIAEEREVRRIDRLLGLS